MDYFLESALLILITMLIILFVVIILVGLGSATAGLVFGLLSLLLSGFINRKRIRFVWHYFLMNSQDGNT